MAGIAGVQHAVEYEGGIVMKGFSSMFVPIKRNGDFVQWHLIASPDYETRLSYRDVLDRCPNRASIKQVDLNCLHTTRAIVGWCREASSLLGSDMANYENIDYSGARDADAPLKFAGGTLGFQQFGIGQFDFTLGPKDGKCHFQRSGPYERIISAAEKAPIVLYDTAEKRSWLEPTSNVILHVAHHRNSLEPFEVDDKRIKFPVTRPTGPSAKEILLKNASVDLSGSEKYTFKDMVLNIWSILEYLIDQNVQRDRTPGVTVNGTLRDIIQGYEFKAVVEERSPFRRKQELIGKTSGGWPTLVRDIAALVLFANGYGDVIRPVENTAESLCNLWKSVPKGKDYLTTSVKVLKDLYDVAGCRLNRTYLTSTQLRWHKGNSSLFEPCKTPGVYRCQCVRLQEIIPKSAIGNIIPPGLLFNDGAVIFGRSGSALRDLISIPHAQGTNSLYSQPNVCLTPVTAYEDRDPTPSSTCSESEPSTQSGSDATGSASLSFTLYTSQGNATIDVTNSKNDSDHTPCTRKRSLTPDGSIRMQNVPQQDIFSPNLMKRARNSRDFNVKGLQRNQLSNPTTWFKDTSSGLSNVMDQNDASRSESPLELRPPFAKQRQERAKEIYYGVAESAYMHPFPSSKEHDLPYANQGNQSPERSPAAVFSLSHTTNSASSSRCF
ncbi:hypothetical protein AOQ84DRAFT_402495 [Glonium stellatum]|uniref:Uncharacterized protein n=1 Tax=Glonium stellatum TaxID=574774 RepID=A0A8E2F4I9_9PEZI|nr:hypothetical protein AOQ84DRAFT_402495 [Glonium stellatum]